MDLPHGYSVDTEKVKQNFFDMIFSTLTNKITNFFQIFKGLADSIGLKGPDLENLNDAVDPEKVKEKLKTTVSSATGIALPEKPATPVAGGASVDNHTPPEPTPARAPETSKSPAKQP